MFPPLPHAVVLQPSVSGMEPPFGDAFQNYSFVDQALTSTELLATSSDPDFMYELVSGYACKCARAHTHNTHGQGTNKNESKQRENTASLFNQSLSAAFLLAARIMSLIVASSAPVFNHTMMSLRSISCSHFLFFFLFKSTFGFAGFCLPDTVTFNTQLSVSNCLAAAAAG